VKAGCHHNRRSAASGGFTLIELVISGGLMTTILVSAYLCLSAGVVSEKLIETRSEAAQTARVALAMIAADLRSAVPLSKEFEFVGMRRVLEGADADNLDFSTRNFSPRNLREGDYCEVSYFLAKDPESKAFTLFRRRDSTPDPEPMAGGRNEEIARGLTGLRFEYYDGWEWYDEWGDPTGKKQSLTFPEPNLSGLPEAVRITLTFDPAYEQKTKREDPDESNEPPVVFQTTARLNMALFFYGSGGGSQTNSTSETAAPSQQQQERTEAAP
jgi:type II secretion system protein J